MYKSFGIKNFRGFKELKIEDLKRLNLIAGKNNVGKTAVLEALFIHCGVLNPELVPVVNAIRGYDIIKLKNRVSSTETTWDSIFYNYNTSNKIELSGTYSDNHRRMLEISIKSSRRINIPASIKEENNSYNQIHTNSSNIMDQYYPALELKSTEPKKKELSNDIVIWPGGISIKQSYKPTNVSYFLSSGRVTNPKENAELLGELEINLKSEEIIPIMQIIEPKLIALNTIPMGNTSVIHANIGIGKLIPVSLLGEGINKLMAIIIRIINAENSCIFIDEIENRFHYSIMNKIWEVIDSVSKKYNVQVFATTHSLECIKAAHETLSSSDYDFSLIRLDKTDDSIIPTYYDCESLDISIENEFEVR
ncbi:AAA family ATPase [Methanoplanus limicola]|uniref:ATPase-like protein n=1 Tax=Methanoplanus limicola DSM 2279 TaxID=937775 RepID=H1Z1F3_9EURY|nr:AAA family ATPase [Methanoplanus limicola]EHQ36300.1 ATPase-like protein [Methanoplanus limicola DSM 2279]